MLGFASAMTIAFTFVLTRKLTKQDIHWSVSIFYFFLTMVIMDGVWQFCAPQIKQTERDLNLYLFCFGLSLVLIIQ